MFCPDGARQQSIPRDNKKIVSFSLTFVSAWLMNNDGVYPRSKHHILVHAQVNADKNVKTLNELLKQRLTEWDQVCRDMDINLPVYDLADAKELYCIMQHL